jgi:hypothetical protein
MSESSNIRTVSFFHKGGARRRALAGRCLAAVGCAARGKTRYGCPRAVYGLFFSHAFWHKKGGVPSLQAGPGFFRAKVDTCEGVVGATCGEYEQPRGGVIRKPRAQPWERGIVKEKTSPNGAQQCAAWPRLRPVGASRNAIFPDPRAAPWAIECRTFGAGIRR